MARRIFITAAEVSGDLHASHLIRSLLFLDPSLQIEAHGGPRMRQAGAHLHVETTARAAMGFQALGRVMEMKKLLKWTTDYFERRPPDLHIGVDSPALNFHFARAAHERGIPVLQYVAPQLWAWREGRMKKVRKWIDKLACILPFEEAYFQSHGVDATFVGHPLFDELRGKDDREAKPYDRQAPVIGLLTGSRRSEAKGNFPRMLEVAAHLRQRLPGARFLVPTTGATHGVVQGELNRLNDAGPFEVAQDAFDALVPRCDLCITVSGTATLHVAIHNVPMIIVYAGSPVLWHAVGRWIIKTRTYGQVNLLAAGAALASSGRVTPDMHIVPEFVPWYGGTGPAAEKALDLLNHPERLQAQRAALRDLVRRLDRPGASMNTARLALGLLNRDSAAVTPPWAG